MMGQAVLDRNATSTWSEFPARSFKSGFKDTISNKIDQLLDSVSTWYKDNFFFSSGTFLGAMSLADYRKREAKKESFRRAMFESIDIMQEMVLADEIGLPDINIWRLALSKIGPYVGDINPPLAYPLQLGGLSLEWHENGINLEIRFYSEDKIYVVVEDAKRDLEEFHGQDKGFLKAQHALEALVSRQQLDDCS